MDKVRIALFLTTLLFLFLWLLKKDRDMSVAPVHTCTGFATSCMDYRFQNRMNVFFNDHFGSSNYDNYIVPGVGLALNGSNSFNETGLIPGGLSTQNYTNAFASTAALAANLERIKRIVLVDHEDCGYYANYFNGTRNMSLTTNGVNTHTTRPYDEVSQIQVSTYYLNQAKETWATLLPQLNNITSTVYQAAKLSSPIDFEGVTIRTFFAYRNNSVVEVGTVRTITN